MCSEVLREVTRNERNFAWLREYEQRVTLFEIGRKKSDLRTIVRDGQLIYLKPAEFHGDPVNPSGGSLVFELPAWDILERAKAAGFTSAYMRFI
jgi:hypothetical protein